MKKLIIINGAPGVGKSTVSRELYKRLDRSIWLDGDWCWMMNPFVVTEENKRMVEDNIIHLLRNSLTNSSFDYVVFNWVIHKEFIFNIILDRLKDLDFELFKISLVCTEEALIKRIKADGRDEISIEIALERMQEYLDMGTIKIETTAIDVNQTVLEIVAIIT